MTATNTGPAGPRSLRQRCGAPRALTLPGRILPERISSPFPSCPCRRGPSWFLLGMHTQQSKRDDEGMVSGDKDFPDCLSPTMIRFPEQLPPAQPRKACCCKGTDKVEMSRKINVYDLANTCLTYELRSKSEFIIRFRKGEDHTSRGRFYSS